MFATIGKSAGAALRAAGRALPVLARDAAGLAGAGLISYGAWLVYVPAGFIVGGVLVLIGVMLASGKPAA
jgi:hypothetical protein